MSLYITAVKRRHEGRLRFDFNTARYVLDGWELHCGDCLEVLFAGTWHHTRIEMMGGGRWYLVGIAAQDLDGLEARSYEY